MNKIVAWLKGIRLDRILTVFMATLLVFVSTACSGGASAKTADEVRPEVPSSANTNRYKGGMNDYSDVDPRFSTKAADTKATELIEDAQKRIDTKSVDSPEQYVKNYRGGAPLDERVKRIGENVGKTAQDVTEDASEGAKKNARSVKAAADDATGSAKQSAKETADAAKETAGTAQSKVKSNIKSAKQTVDQTADQAADQGENLGDKIKQAAQDAADAVKDTFD